MTQYSLAIVGYGTVTKAHVAALQRIPNVTITAIVSSHMTQDEYDKTKPFGELRIFNTIDTLLAEDAAGNIQVDVVDICNRPDHHTENALKAIEHGKHLIIEKPIALNIEDCYTIAKAAKAKGVHVCVCFECRFSDQFTKTKQAIANYLGISEHALLGTAMGLGPPTLNFTGIFRKKVAGIVSCLPVVMP